MSKSKRKKEYKRKLKKLDVGESFMIGDYEIIGVGSKSSYLVVHQQFGIFDKTYSELLEWIDNGGELD